MQFKKTVSPAAALALWLAGITLAWAAAQAIDGTALPALVAADGSAPGLWRLRQDGLYLSGLWSISLMSLAMVLALRLPMAERLLGGMDQVYRLHRWAGIAAIATGALHWGIKLSSAGIKPLWGTAARGARLAVMPWMTGQRAIAKDLGEWALYLLLAMALLTLCRQLLAYRRWRLLHKAMPLLYLAPVFHTLALTPVSYWGQPPGWLLAPCLVAGSLAALVSLAGLVGRSRRHGARVHSVRRLRGEGMGDGEPPRDAPVEVVCAMPRSWPGHRAGQFVWLRLDADGEAHPFTVASAPGSLGTGAHGEPLLRLIIKPLGHWTRSLPARLRAAQAVQVEGPYGCFDGHGRAGQPQVWVAGGIGVTPFLALLEARQQGAAPLWTEEGGGNAPAVRMHYCTRDARTDALLPALGALCATARPEVRLTVHSAADGSHLRGGPLLAAGGGEAPELWFCGPEGLGRALRHDLGHLGARGLRFHQEAFAMR